MVIAESEVAALRFVDAETLRDSMFMRGTAFQMF